MKKYLFLYTLLSLFFVSCSEEELIEKGERLTVHLSLSPALSTVDHRSLGDPGETEEFDLPRYLYFYVVNSSQNAPDESYVNSMVMEKVEWAYNETDRTYVLKNTVPALVLSARNIDLTKSHVYVIASVQPLNFIEPKTKGEVENLTFDVRQQGEGFLLKDVYANSFYDKANGALSQGTGALEASVTCYHVAAKVDMMWNVSTDKQKDYWVESLTLKNLPVVGHFFKPKENTGVSNNSLTYHTHIGNQWLGRTVFYALDHHSLVCDYTLHHANAVPEQEVKTVEYATDGVSEVYANWYVIRQKIGY